MTTSSGDAVVNAAGGGVVGAENFEARRHTRDGADKGRDGAAVLVCPLCANAVVDYETSVRRGDSFEMPVGIEPTKGVQEVDRRVVRPRVFVCSVIEGQANVGRIALSQVGGSG